MPGAYMHTLFMIEMSVRKTMPTSDGFLALFLLQPNNFSSEKGELPCTPIRLITDLELQTSLTGKYSNTHKRTY
jgi:hypothetical protein